MGQVQIDVRQAEALFDVLDYNNSGTLDSEEFLEADLYRLFAADLAWNMSTT